MPLFALYVHAEPSNALDTGHYTRSSAAVLEASILLYMKLQVTRKGIGEAIRFTRAGVANLGEL